MAAADETSSHPDAGEKEENTKPSETVEKQNEGQQSSDDSKQLQNDDNVEAKFPSWPKRFQDVQPRIQDCNYHQFKNFLNDAEMNAAIYALYGGRSLKSEIKKEKDWRKSVEASRSDPRDYVKSSGKENDAGDGGDSVDNKVLHRIRIQSPYILKHLCKLTDENYDSDRHFVFLRPFRILTHIQPKMKAMLEDLRSKWAGTSTTDLATDDAKGTESSNLDFDSIELLDSKNALAHMEAYVEFIDTKVVPLEKQFIQPNSVRTKVAFDDLLYLFREGQFVYRPLPSNKKTLNDANSTSSSSMSSTYQHLWRVYSILIPCAAHDPDEAALAEFNKGDQVDNHYSADDGDDDCGTSNDPPVFRVYCYYIDFDGESYSPYYHCINIKKYDGEKPIRSLPIYPVQYLDNSKDLLDRYEKSGNEFMEYIRQRHVYHFGWTVSHQPTGFSIYDREKYPQFIDSEFIIDFQEAYQTSPFWQPDSSHTPSLSPGTLTIYWSSDDCSDVSLKTWRWSENVKGKNEHDCNRMIDGDSVGRIRRNKFLLSNEFLSACRSGAYIEPQGVERCLLPRRLVGFALRERKFVNVSISSIRHIKEQSKAFDMLKLDPGHKLMVRSLVKEHFRLKARREKGDDMINQDVIKGKGTGVVFLLHGVPGVGKTATAEAIAQENKTPLFAITCGDLGVEPMEVETNLTRIFRWATVWGCILLLDEADIFFTRRNPSDLQRNALVTVFLRVLEYYSGILFLTTNRVGIMDEAFKSRIHMSLYYPPLDLDQTTQIFWLNIERLKAMEAAEPDKIHSITVDESSIMTWAENHFLSNPELGRWNGRQIRNAFQTAASLAHYDALNPQGVEGAAKPGVLNWVQFNKVAQATRQFDVYMTKVRRATDGEFARRDGIRTDDHGNTAPPLGGTDRVFGMPQSQRHTATTSHGRTIHTSQDMMCSPTHAQSQHPAQEMAYQSSAYGRSASAQAYDRAATTTPSRVPPQQIQQPDSGISLDNGYRTQVFEHVLEERASQAMVTPMVKQPYIQPDGYDTRPYQHSPAQAENQHAGYQGYQPSRNLGNMEQGMWEDSRR